METFIYFRKAFQVLQMNHTEQDNKSLYGLLLKVYAIDRMRYITIQVVSNTKLEKNC